MAAFVKAFREAVIESVTGLFIEFPRDEDPNNVFPYNFDITLED